MRAAGSPLGDRFVSTAVWAAISVVVTAAGTVLALAPSDGGRPTPGDVVTYSEDKIGRPWRVVREHEFGRFLIRNGRVFAIADACEIAPYASPSKDVTVQMAGHLWRDKVAEIRGGRLADTTPDRRLWAARDVRP
ncbi:MAG TPA: hypothetical protein VF170_00840 [Planctomycetaceae bacterium]